MRPSALIVRFEEVLDFAQAAGIERLKVPKRCSIDRGLGAAEQAVIANALALLDLPSAQNADQAHGRKTARKCRRQPQHKHIEGIPVGGARSGYGAEIMGKAHASGQHAAYPEQLQLGIIFVFISTPRRSVDDDMDES